MMKRIFRIKLSKVCFVLLFAVFCRTSLMSDCSWGAEQAYPSKPINLIVPFAVGGGVDLSSKVFAEKMQKSLGQPVISVYKTGAGGSIGASFVAKTKPDGYTMIVGSSSPLTISPVAKKTDYTLDDFTFIGMYAKSMSALAVKTDARWKTLKDFIDEAKRSPVSLKVGSTGMLTLAHFGIELLNRYAEIKLNHIPYESGTDALIAVLGGHLDGAFIAGSQGFLQSNQIRLLAMYGDERFGLYPDVPTFSELGYPIPFSLPWYCFAVPKGVPKEVVDKLHNALKMVFDTYPDEIKKSLKPIDYYPFYLNPQESYRHAKKDYDNMGKIVETLGLVKK